MKYFIAGFAMLLTANAFAASTCTDVKSQTTAGRDAVKALVALSGTAPVLNYWGNAIGDGKGNYKVTVEPHYAGAKDIYQAIVRFSDCRVMSVELRAENIAIDNACKEGDEARGCCHNNENVCPN